MPATIARMAGSYRLGRPAPKGALVYGILQAFASLESGNIARCDVDRLTRPRVASHAGSARLDREGAEAHQRDGTALCQRALDGVQCSIDGFRCIRA